MKFRIEDDGVAAEAGELVVKSRYLALGYWQGGRLQQGPFQSDPADPSVRILRTGDGVRLRPDGLSEMTGRMDRQVKVRGWRVDLAEVEAILRGCDGVADAAVIAHRQGEDVSALVAYVVPRDPLRATFAIDLKDAVAERLPWRMRPAQYRILDALPRLHGFKTDLQALERLDQRELAAPVAMSVPPTRPYRPTEQPLLQLCRDIFQLATLGIHDNFFDSGADSLSVLTLLLEVERYWCVTITVADMFSAPTVAEFATVIDQAADRGQPPQLAIIQAGASLPPFFCLGAGPRYRELARLLGPKQPFIGPVHPRPSELSGAIKIEDVAAHFVRIVRNAQPRGPYFLGGFCIDGLVAYEVAQQLHALGEPVALLVLFDTSFYSSRLVVIYGHVRAGVIRGAKRVVSVIQRWRWNKISGYLHRRLGSLGDRVQRLFARGRAGELHGMVGWMDMAVQRRAAEAYRPLPYDGRVLHLQRSVWQTRWTRARQDWSSLVRDGYETDDIPGDHFGMFVKANVVFTAEILRASLCTVQEIYGVADTITNTKSLKA
jgi:thioesterase domain-containing protein